MKISNRVPVVNLEVYEESTFSLKPIPCSKSNDSVQYQETIIIINCLLSILDPHCKALFKINAII